MYYNVHGYTLIKNAENRTDRAVAERQFSKKTRQAGPRPNAYDDGFSHRRCIGLLTSAQQGTHPQKGRITQRRRKTAYNQNMLTRPVHPLCMPDSRTIPPQRSRLRACAQKAFGWGHGAEPEALQPFSWPLAFRRALNSVALPSWQGSFVPGRGRDISLCARRNLGLAAPRDRLSNRASSPDDPCPALPRDQRSSNEHIAYLATTFPHAFQIVR